MGNLAATIGGEADDRAAEKRRLVRQAARAVKPQSAPCALPHARGRHGQVQRHVFRNLSIVARPSQKAYKK